MKKTIIILSAVLAALALTGCNEKNSDRVQAEQQEVLLQEGTSQVGMPAIKNFRERKMLKMIYELRDQESFATYTYVVSQQTGELKLLCKSIGYAINDATGFTNPNKIVRDNGTAYGTNTQAEPNGLFTPDTSNSYWVICVGRNNQPQPVFVGTPVVVSPYEL